jgi:methionyl aminopeptidase
MRESGKKTSELLSYAKTLVKPGVSTLELNQALAEYMHKLGVIPAFLNQDGFPGVACISVNEVVVHGIPSKSVVLKEGDIVSVDLGVIINGYYSDAARTFPVGKINEEVEKLIKTTEECFFKGVDQLKVGGDLENVSIAIQNHAESNGYSVVRELVGHGIGKKLHMEPQIANYKTGRSYILQENTCLAIEPMINLGKKDIAMKADGWTIFTRDFKPSAHYENTVLLTKNGVEILTL